MALLLLRHASSVPDSDGDGDEDASTFLTVSIMLGDKSSTANSFIFYYCKCEDNQEQDTCPIHNTGLFGLNVVLFIMNNPVVFRLTEWDTFSAILMFAMKDKFSFESAPMLGYIYIHIYIYSQ